MIRKAVLLCAILATVSAFTEIAHAEDVFFVIRPITNILRRPDATVDDGKVSTTINVTATPGEFEPASVVLYTRWGLRCVSFKVGNLASNNGAIDADSVDIRTVKCWYQAGPWWRNPRGQKTERLLLPELLLKDDSLVRVDYDRQINYVKIQNPTGHWREGAHYVDMSQVKPKKQPGMANSQFPVRDSKTFVPVDIPQHTYKQIWITVHVPDDAKPGLYTGKIEVSACGTKLPTLTLNLKVLPFKLADPKTYYDSGKTFTSSIYYKGILTWNREGALRGWYKNHEQFRADLKNMEEHGVTNPLILQLEVDDNLEHLEEVLKIRKELGLINDPLYLLGKEKNMGFGTTTDPEKIKQAQKRFKAVDSIAKKHGIKQVFIYGMDEQTGEKLLAQKTIWKALQSAGAKIFTSSQMQYKPSAFELVGDTLDVLVKAGRPLRKFAKQWHSLGKQIWNYGNPQSGFDMTPAVYRRNYGLVLWKANYDGACTYVYHHGYGHSWNDFDSMDLDRVDMNLTYPTIDGVIDTIAWEAYREGVDDIRYATTLKLAIEKTLAGSNPQKKKIAKEASDWLENVDVEHRNLDTVRLEIIRYILKLMEK